jgi:hypothetical protein
VDDVGVGQLTGFVATTRQVFLASSASAQETTRRRLSSVGCFDFLTDLFRRLVVVYSDSQLQSPVVFCWARALFGSF